MEVYLLLDKDLVELERLTESKDTPVRHLRLRSRVVSYFMGDSSGKELGFSPLRGDMVDFDSGYLRLIYKGRSSNFRGPNNLMNIVRTGVDTGGAAWYGAVLIYIKLGFRKAFLIKVAYNIPFFFTTMLRLIDIQM